MGLHQTGRDRERERWKNVRQENVCDIKARHFMMLNGALANVTQPLKHFDESDMSPQNEGFIELLNIPFGLLNHSCQIFGKPFY